jgi:hypothetical protein
MNVEISDRVQPSRRWQETARLALRRLFKRLSPASARLALRRLFKRLSPASARHREMSVMLHEIAVRQKEERAWRKVFRDQLNALVRHQFLAGADIPDPYWLKAQRFRMRSQNEEDGITLALLKVAGVVNRRFVEIGCGKTGGNSAVLAFDYGWTGLMVDAQVKKVASLRRALAFNPAVKVIEALVTPDNLNQLLKEHGCAGEVDFMSIDVDSIDYWLLEALEVCSPRVLVMEYNALFGPDRALTLPPTGLPSPCPKGYFGASLLALEKKAREKGYRLVMCESAGVNAFFVRDDVAPQIKGLSPTEALSMIERSKIEKVESTIDIFAVMKDHRLPIVEV